MANTFRLRVVSLDGVEFKGDVQSISCRAIDGDLAILAGHSNFCTAVGMGTAKIVDDKGEEKKAACVGGMLSVINGQCSLIVTTWEWEDEIDVQRAEKAKEKAERTLERMDLTDREFAIANAKLKRALVRLSSVR